MCKVVADLSKDGKPLQLRDVAAALRKADDPQGIPPALRAADALVAAHPDELRHYAGEHALLHCHARVYVQQVYILGRQAGKIDLVDLSGNARHWSTSF